MEVTERGRNTKPVIKNGTAYIEFDDPYHHLEYALQSNYMDNNNDSRWVGTRNTEEFLEICKNGYDLENVSMVADLMTMDIQTELEKDVTIDAEGEQLHWGRYFENDPECLLNWFGLGDQQKAYVNLVVHISENAGMSKEQSVNKMAVVMAISELLERNDQIRVKVDMTNGATHCYGFYHLREQLSPDEFKKMRWSNLVTVTSVKDYDGYLNMPMWTAMSHISWERRINFKTTDQAGSKNGEMGRAIREEKMIYQLKKMGNTSINFDDPMTIIIPSIEFSMGKFDDLASAEEYAIDIMNKIEQAITENYN